MKRQKRRGEFHVLTYLLAFVGAAVTTWAFLVPSHHTLPPIVANPPDYSVGPTNWWELNLLKNKPASSSESSVLVELSPEDLYDRVTPAVVTILIKDEKDELIGRGTGFFINDVLLRDRFKGEPYKWLEVDKSSARVLSKNGTPTQHGYVLTNFHVMRPAVSADVYLFNGDEGTVTHVIGEDESADLALLSVNVSSAQPLRTIPVATSNPRILSTVYAIGSPKGLDGTASEGKVSAYRALFGSDFWMQTTAPISPGSSGGALVSPEGQLVGITTLGGTEGQNLNFAIPASTVHSFFLVTNFNLRRRDVAEGASLRWHEERAFCELQTAIDTSSYTAAQHDALELLDEARKELLLGQLLEENRDEQVSHYRQAMVLATDANVKLPGEFKYLSHYVAGKAGIAAQEVPALPVIRTSNFAPAREIYFTDDNETTTAIVHFEEAARLEPQFAPPNEYLALYHAYCGDWSDSLIASRTLVQLLPRNVPATQLLADCYVQLGQPERAIEVLESAVRHLQHSGTLLYQLARTHSEMANYQAAIEYYGAALDCSLPGRYGAVHYYCGVAYKELEQFEEAIAEFNSAKSYGWNGDDCGDRIAECKQQFSHIAETNGLKESTEGQREITVYVTKRGTKYHNEGCKYLRLDRTAMPLGEAAKTYEPCSSCSVPPAAD